MNKKGVFITGIGTDVGKTLVSAILTEAWKADYYKPIQAGSLDSSDASFVKEIISNSTSTIHPSTFNLKTAASPHHAAEIENIELKLPQFKIPESKNPIIIEGAGGIMVPINKKECILDLIQYFQLPVILVSSNYLGAINHTLLSAEILKQREIPVLGIIYSGGTRLENQSAIENFSRIPTLGIIPQLSLINKESILNEATKFAPINPFQ